MNGVYLFLVTNIRVRSNNWIQLHIYRIEPQFIDISNQQQSTVQVQNRIIVTICITIDNQQTIHHEHCTNISNGTTQCQPGQDTIGNDLSYIIYIYIDSLK